MLERFPCRDALLGVVYEDLAQQIQEQLVELRSRRDCLLQSLHPTDEFPRLPWSLSKRIGEVTVLEEARGRLAVALLGASADFADYALVDVDARDGLEEVGVSKNHNF